MSLEGVPRFTTDVREHLRQLSDKFNAAINGGGNNTGTVTLTASDTTTTLTDSRIGRTSVITLMPMTANASAALASVFYETPGAGSIIINHASDAATDQTFRYAITGS